MLAFTIGFLKSDYIGSTKNNYATFKEKIFNENKREKMANVVAVILAIVVDLITILITIGSTMYSWNNILPQLLGIELVQINFVQAFGFAYLFNLLFKSTKSYDKKSKKDEDKESKENAKKEEKTEGTTTANNLISEEQHIE